MRVSSKLKLGILSDDYIATSNLISLGSGQNVDETDVAGQDKSGELGTWIKRHM